MTAKWIETYVRKMWVNRWGNFMGSSQRDALLDELSIISPNPRDATSVLLAALIERVDELEKRNEYRGTDGNP
jgi:hypothetical protein